MRGGEWKGELCRLRGPLRAFFPAIKKELALCDVSEKDAAITLGILLNTERHPIVQERQPFMCLKLGDQFTRGLS
jgi:hypothetical protein